MQQELNKCLNKHNVTTKTMEGKGIYWQNLYSILVTEGFEVILVNGRQTRNIKEKKQTLKIASGYRNSIHLDY